jgi:hypothetical protein
LTAVFPDRSAATLLAVAALLGCGIATASPGPLPLSARLIRAGDFTGFRPDPGLSTFDTPALWVAANPSLTPAQRSAEVARLRRHGFVRVVSEFLDRKALSQSGVSWVMRVGSPPAARAELKANFEFFEALDKASGGFFSAYSVRAIPGAKGFRVVGHGQVAENVFFADGPFLYLVGAGWPISDKQPPSRAQLVSAVTRLYKRVHGRPAA